MTGGLGPGAAALADALVEATRFGGRLYDGNAFCVEDARISEQVRFVLDDGNEAYPVDLALGHTYLLVGVRAIPVAPGTARATADALARGAAPAWTVCDYCTGAVAPVAGLLPVGAGASVAVLLLCGTCRDFLTDAMPSAHFIATED